MAKHESDVEGFVLVFAWFSDDGLIELVVSVENDDMHYRGLASLCLWITNDVIWIMFQKRSVSREDQFEMQCVRHEVADWDGRHSFCYNPFLLHDS